MGRCKVGAQRSGNCRGSGWSLAGVAWPRRALRRPISMTVVLAAAEAVVGPAEASGAPPGPVSRGGCAGPTPPQKLTDRSLQWRWALPGRHGRVGRPEPVPPQPGGGCLPSCFASLYLACSRVGNPNSGRQRGWRARSCCMHAAVPLPLERELTGSGIPCEQWLGWSSTATGLWVCARKGIATGYDTTVGWLAALVPLGNAHMGGGGILQVRRTRPPGP